MTKSPQAVVQENPNASVNAVVGSGVTVVAVLVSDIIGWSPSTDAFWPAVVVVVTTLALALGKRSKKAAQP